MIKDVAMLLEKKKAAAEMDDAPAMPALNAYIESELQRLEAYTREPDGFRTKLDAASALFRALVQEPRPA